MQFYKMESGVKMKKAKEKMKGDCCGQFSKLFAHFGKRSKDIYISFISQRPIWPHDPSH